MPSSGAVKCFPAPNKVSRRLLPVQVLQLELVATRVSRVPLLLLHVTETRRLTFIDSTFGTFGAGRLRHQFIDMPTVSRSGRPPTSIADSTHATPWPWRRVIN